MKTKIAALLFVVMVVGVFSFTRTKNAPPSDLRDAVAEDFNTDISAVENIDENLLVPTPDKAESARENVPRKKAILLKGINTKTEWQNLILGGHEFGKSKSKSSQELSMADEASFNKLKSETGIQGSTPYDVLKKLFDQGTPATKKDLTGWYSGRCIDSRYPKEFLASLFVGRLAPLHQNGGPLFSKEEVFFVNSFAWYKNIDDSVPPDYFDNQTWDRNEVLIDYGNGAETVHLVDYIEESFGQPKCTFAIAFPSAEGIIKHEHDKGKATLQYRKADGYIFEHFLSSDATVKTLTESYSYYFKNVTPKD